VDSERERERAGDSWERGSIVVSLHTHSCAHMFMFFFMWANGWAGEQRKGRRVCISCEWGGVLELVTHVQESVPYCFMWANGWAG
jgi:hypothetical protein